MNIRNFFNLAYLTANESASFGSEKIVLFFIITLAIFSVLLLCYANKRLSKIEITRAFFLLFGLLLFGIAFYGGVVYFSIQGQLPFLDTRLMLIMLPFLCFIYLLYFDYYLFIRYPKKIEEYKRKETHKKYLPRRRK